jgi:protein PhnA
MSDLPKCPACDAEYTYLDGLLFICPSCAHEWAASEVKAEDEAPPAGGPVVRDANGNVLHSGDSVIVIKDLKVKGSSLVVKGGTKVKNIRLVDGDHNIDCKIAGVGAMQLKSEFVRKA